MFQYNGYDVYDMILSDISEREKAKEIGIQLNKMKEERIKIYSFPAKVYCTKYSYVSKTAGDAFCYAYMENHGSDGYGVYMLTSKGDFDDLNDLFFSYLDYNDPGRGWKKMKINHYTLNTGNMRMSEVAEINTDIYFRLKSIINRARRGKTELLDNTYIEISEDDYGYICDLYGKRGKEYILILSTAGTKTEPGRKYIWDSMEVIAKAEYGNKYTYRVPVEVPYIIDLVHIPSVYFTEVLDWTGDFARCLGWMLLFPEEVRRKV